MARVRRRPPGSRWLRRLLEIPAWIRLAFVGVVLTAGVLVSVPKQFGDARTAFVAAVLTVGALVNVPKQFGDAWTSARGKPNVTSTDLDELEIGVDVQKYLDVLGPADVKDYCTVADRDPSVPNSMKGDQKWSRYEWNSHKGLKVVALTSESGRVIAYTLKTYQKDITPAIKALGGQLNRSTFKGIVENPEATGTTVTLKTRDAAVYAHTTAPIYKETYYIANPAWVSIVLSKGGNRWNDQPHATGDLFLADRAIMDLVRGDAGNTVPCIFSQCREKPSRALQDFRASNGPDAFSLIADGVDADFASKVLG